MSEICLPQIHDLLSLLSPSLMEAVHDKSRSLIVHLIGCCVIGSVEMKNGEAIRSPTRVY